MLFLTPNLAIEALSQDWRWPHFSIAELVCKCTGRFCQGEYWHDPVFLDGLEQVRGDIGTPIHITSAHRCKQWNACVGGAPLSQHKHMAADLSLHGHDRHLVLRAARLAGFTGFGLARTFLHIDRRVRPALWYYSGSKSLWQTSLD